MSGPESPIPIMKGGTHQPIGEKKSLNYAYFEYPGAHSVKKHEGAFEMDIQRLFISTFGMNGNSYDLQSDPKEMSNCLLSPKKMHEPSKSECNQLKRLKEEV